MKEKTNQKGFTLLEILVAVGIMTLGFLAVSQMQFLSLRQAGLAESGTTATNIIDLAANRDMQELRRLHLLNFRAFNLARDGVDVTSSPYCTGSDAVCTNCPCDPVLEVLGTNVTTLGNTSLADIQGGTGAAAFPDDLIAQTCASIELNNFDPAEINYIAAGSTTLPAGCTNSEFILLRFVEAFRFNGNPLTDPDIISLRITYGIKTLREIARDTRQGVSNSNINLSRTVASQTYGLSAYIETDWDRVVTNWDPVIIPNVP